MEDRDTNVLLLITEKYVSPWKALVPYLWAVYSTIQNLFEAYTHATTNYFLNFLRSDNAAFTNTAESTRQKFKLGRKKRFTLNETLR